MSWLSVRLKELIEARGQSVESVAYGLAIERSHLSMIIADSREPNDSLIRRLALYFDEDPAEWLAEASKSGRPAETTRAQATGYVKVAHVSEIPEGELLSVLEGRAVIANVSGAFYAFASTCPHAGGNLGEGFLEEAVVECPWHAGRWDVRTGEALTILGTANITTYEVRLSGEEIELLLG